MDVASWYAGSPVLCSGHAVQKWIAPLARFNKAMALICTKLPALGHVRML